MKPRLALTEGSTGEAFDSEMSGADFFQYSCWLRKDRAEGEGLDYYDLGRRVGQRGEELKGGV